MQNLPKITLGFISYNRLHYLRATLESARRCIQYPNIEWIVVDGNSSESGLQEYLRSCVWIDKLIVKPTKFSDCLNILVQEASGDYILLWPDDMQFIVEGGWMADVVQILQNNQSIGGVSLAALRRLTIKNLFTYRRWGSLRLIYKELLNQGVRFRQQKTIKVNNGIGVRTYGHLAPGIVLDGIPTFSRTQIWRDLGPWNKKEDKLNDLIDAGEGAAEDMFSRSKKFVQQIQFSTMILPVAADIINDKFGSKAKIRTGMRYGDYTPPSEGGVYYYQIFQQDDLMDLAREKLPIAFEDFVKPIGFELPLDVHGNLLKNSLNTSVVRPID